MFKAGKYSLPLGKKTYVMGILNYTPDSFSDGGLYNTPEKALEHALEMQTMGADIIDLGAYSTRPDAPVLSAAQELERITPALEILKGKLSVPLSIDTFYPAVARAALKEGADIINDVSGVFSRDVAALAKEYGAGYIVMHNPCGSTETAEYENGVVADVRKFFVDAMQLASECELPLKQLCLDPGLGFSKSYEDNLELLKNMQWLKFKGVALLAAASRKRFIGRATGDRNYADRDVATAVAHASAIAGGADIIRVHNVECAVRGAKMADALYRGEKIDG